MKQKGNAKNKKKYIITEVWVSTVSQQNKRYSITSQQKISA